MKPLWWYKRHCENILARFLRLPAKLIGYCLDCGEWCNTTSSGRFICPNCGKKLCLINCFSHLVIDYFTSKINKYLWDTRQVHRFWCSIGFDQFLHITILVWTISVFVK